MLRDGWLRLEMSLGLSRETVRELVRGRSLALLPGPGEDPHRLHHSSQNMRTIFLQNKLIRSIGMRTLEYFPVRLILDVPWRHNRSLGPVTSVTRRVLFDRHSLAVCEIKQDAPPPPTTQFSLAWLHVYLPE